MKIDKIEINNFGIYYGNNLLHFKDLPGKNLTLISGKNGYGKTTFLTALVWVFYGRLMSQVEEKYRKDIKSADGYENYILNLFNNAAKKDLDQLSLRSHVMSVEVKLTDIYIPSIPCKEVTIKRTYNITQKRESLIVLIDGDENELTKEVGYELFINDFILPREIAKFFFFDAEKIVSLAEAKSKHELRSLSRAYSEVLGIKKYEELRKNLESLLSRLRRAGATESQKVKLDELRAVEENLADEIDYNQDRQDEIDNKIIVLRQKSDYLQEKLIREGNAITLEELNELTERKKELKEESKKIKGKLKKLMEQAPLIIAGNHLLKLNEQLNLEKDIIRESVDANIIKEEISSYSQTLYSNINSLLGDASLKDAIKKTFDESLQNKFETYKTPKKDARILLEFSSERHREFQALLLNIKTSYLEQFNKIVQEEKNVKIVYNSTARKIKQAEARKDNHLAKKYRQEKIEIEHEIQDLINKKNELTGEFGSLNQQRTTNLKILSEIEKTYNIAKADEKKFVVTQKLLDKINELIIRIKEEKKYALEKNILLSLKKLMHKNNFINKVNISIREDIMDIHLIDKNEVGIEKDTLSKGEQQLYATALLKALVDESGIKFPIFIDSPLQKFDKMHAENVIAEFYPTISEQVVLFPLLEKELSQSEYELLKPNLNQVFLIENTATGSSIKPVANDKLFAEYKTQEHVSTY